MKIIYLCTAFGKLLGAVQIVSCNAVCTNQLVLHPYEVAITSTSQDYIEGRLLGNKVVARAPDSLGKHLAIGLGRVSDVNSSKRIVMEKLNNETLANGQNVQQAQNSLAGQVNNKEGEKAPYSLFQNLRAFSSAKVGLDEIVRLIRYDKSVADKTNAYRKVKAAVGKQTADEEIKKKLAPAFAVAVVFDDTGRDVKNILRFSGRGICDLDKVDDVETAFARVASDPHTLLAYRTIGGSGLRAIFTYRREDASLPLDESSWPAAFLKGNRHYAELTGCEPDGQCKFFKVLSGLAHDEGVFVNPEAEPFIVTDEEILSANFSPENESGKPRKAYEPGTFDVGVETAWEKIQKQLQKRQIEFKAGHHHDFVMHAAFLFNRYGVGLEQLIDWASTEWNAYADKAREATIRSCYRKTDEHGTWKLNPSGRKKKNALASLSDIGDWLKSHMELQYNDVNDRTYYRAGEGQKWLEVDNRVICTIRKQIEADTGKRTLKSDVTDVIWSDSAFLVHPIRDYINGLPAWDGTDRVAELAGYVSVEPVQDGQSPDDAQALFLWALRKWLVAIVATWMDDNVSNHEILTLIGPQGIFKTTFFRQLLPPELRQYFWENPRNNFRSKDDKISLAENALVEIEEVDISNPIDIAELKALASAVSINERRPYGKQRNQKHKLASLCATGNEQHFLIDETGNRRWLCFLIKRILPPQQWAIDYGQLYAQLFEAYNGGFQYWFDYDDQQRVEQQNMAFRLMSDEEQLIRTNFRQPRQDDPVKLMNAASICKALNGGRLGYGLSSKKVGTIMKKLGFRLIHNSKGNFYRVHVIADNDVQSLIAAASDEKQPVKATTEEQVLPF